MTGIELSKTERTWLIKVITARLNMLSGHQPTNTKHQRTINKILSKVSASDISFTPFEKLMCRSCIVEHLPLYDSRINIDSDPMSLFSIRNLRDFIEIMDMGKDLLVRFGYKNNRYIKRFDFSYRYITTASYAKDKKHNYARI